MGEFFLDEDLADLSAKQFRNRLNFAFLQPRNNCLTTLLTLFRFDY